MISMDEVTRLEKLGVVDIACEAVCLAAYLKRKDADQLTDSIIQRTVGIMADIVTMHSMSGEEEKATTISIVQKAQHKDKVAQVSRIAVALAIMANETNKPPVQPQPPSNMN